MFDDKLVAAVQAHTTPHVLPLPLYLATSATAPKPECGTKPLAVP